MMSPLFARVLAAFQPLFSDQSWGNAQTLLIGTLLTRGRRTVSTALRSMGVHETGNFGKYHRFLNRAGWSARAVSRCLLHRIVTTFLAPGGVLTLAIDDTLERRWDAHITKRGHWRDSLLSSRQCAMSNSGVRWVVMAAVVPIPWATRWWALPFLRVLTSPRSVDETVGKRHKTTVAWAQQRVRTVRRWLPDVPMTRVGDTG